MVAQAVVTPHPESSHLPVIDYTLVLALTPCLMLGLGLGVLLNAVISQWLLNLIVISVWSWSCVQLCMTYRGARLKERQRQQQQQQVKLDQQAAAAVAAEAANLNATAAAAISKLPCAGAVAVCNAMQSGMLLHSRNKSQAVELSIMRKCLNLRAGVVRTIMSRVRNWAGIQPWEIIAPTAGLFGVFITAQVVRGTVLPQCSTGWWVALGVTCCVSALAAVCVTMWLLQQQAQVMQPSAASLPAAAAGKACTGEAAAGLYGEVGVLGSVVSWGPGVLASLHVLMLIAGLLLGVWPLSPIIMALKGMHPQVAAATSKLMLFMITAGAGLSFIASSSVSLSYMLVYGLTNAVTTPLGVWVADRVIKRTGRPSILLLLTIGRLAACVVVQTAFAVVPSLIALSKGLPRAGFLASWPEQCAAHT